MVRGRGEVVLVRVASPLKEASQPPHAAVSHEEQDKSKAEGSVRIRKPGPETYDFKAYFEQLTQSNSRRGRTIASSKKVYHPLGLKYCFICMFKVRVHGVTLCVDAVYLLEWKMTTM